MSGESVNLRLCLTPHSGLADTQGKLCERGDSRRLARHHLCSFPWISTSSMPAAGSTPDLGCVVGTLSRQQSLATRMGFLTDLSIDKLMMCRKDAYMQKTSAITSVLLKRSKHEDGAKRTPSGITGPWLAFPVPVTRD
jgi:hypothetical protein